MVDNSKDVNIKKETIKEKVYNGERLRFEEGLFLFETKDLLTVGELANYINNKKK